MDRPEFDWDDANQNHLALNNDHPERGRASDSRSSCRTDRDPNWLRKRTKAVGMTGSGRILAIIITFRGDAIRPITAYPATVRLQKLYLGRRVHDLKTQHPEIQVRSQRSRIGGTSIATRRYSGWKQRSQRARTPLLLKSANEPTSAPAIHPLFRFVSILRTLPARGHWRPRRAFSTRPTSSRSYTRPFSERNGPDRSSLANAIDPLTGFSCPSSNRGTSRLPGCTARCPNACQDRA